MYRLFQKSNFLIFLFILFCFLLTIFVIPLLDNLSTLSAFIAVYLFWFLLLILSFLISRSIANNNSDIEKEESV